MADETEVYNSARGSGKLSLKGVEVPIKWKNIRFLKIFGIRYIDFV